jgi:putative endonuclease
MFFKFRRRVGADDKSLGAAGEDLAARHLNKMGFAILEKNYRCPLGELDIVARKGPLLIFVEVKTLRSEKYGPPQVAVTIRKQQKIIKLAHFYIKHKKMYDMQCRFDVIAVQWTGDRPQIKHIPAAFISRY